METAKTEIKLAAAEVVRVITKAAEDAATVVKLAAAESAKIVTTDAAILRVDHDLLVTLNEKVSGIKEDIKGIKDDHEERLRRVQTEVTRIKTFGTAALIILGIIEFLINQYAHKT